MMSRAVESTRVIPDPYQPAMFFFFLKAEDGIRYLTVTGVQTCALPICRDPLHVPFARGAAFDFVLLFPRLGREIAQVLMPGLVAEYAPQDRDRPSGAAAAAA